MQSSYQYSSVESPSPNNFVDYSPADDICNEIVKELQLQSIKDIIPRVIHLKEYYSLSKEFRKLYKKLAESMIRKVGKHNITGLPSCMSLWKWVSNELVTLQKLFVTAKVKSLPELVDKIKNR